MPELIGALIGAVFLIELGLLVYLAARRRWAALRWLVGGMLAGAAVSHILWSVFALSYLPSNTPPASSGVETGFAFALSGVAAALIGYAAAVSGGLLGGIAGLAAGHLREKHRSAQPTYGPKAEPHA